MPEPSPFLEFALRIDRERADALAESLPAAASTSAQLSREHSILLATAYPALAGAVHDWAEDMPSPSLLSRAELVARSRALSEQQPAQQAEQQGEDGFRMALRRFAQRERLRIALAELLPESLGGSDFEATSSAVSALADVTIESALVEARAHCFARMGAPESVHGIGKLVVLGMGKLGGEELNPGSDVDLICFYDTDEGVACSPSGEQHSPHEVWTKVVQRMTANLAEVTEHGFVWRVDLRLRPEGARGALVNGLAAAERYYETFGRLWERAALLRARPCAGDLSLGAQLLEMLSPFIWSRQVDPTIAQRMYDLVHQARIESSPAPGRDLKLGPGGIREAEFFVQTLQLVWGGLSPRIRCRGTIETANRLRDRGLLTEREAAELTTAYLALRRAEHAVQWASGHQTHRLPKDDDGMGKLAHTLGFEHAAAFQDDLSLHLERVGALLGSLLPEAAPGPSRWSSVLFALARGDFDAMASALLEAGGRALADPEQQLARDVFELAGQHPDGILGSRTRERYRSHVETLLDALADAADPALAARYLRRFAARNRPVAIYTKMLADNPARTRRLVTALGGSAFVGDAVADHPELADLITFESVSLTPEEVRTEVLETLARSGQQLRNDVEAQAGVLRRAKNRLTLQIALADLAGEIEVMAATRALAALADGVLEGATRCALGTPPQQMPQGLCVLAMGKLGGQEIGYGSDLDVIFLFDPAAADDPDDATAFFARRARRVIQLIGMHHHEGPGYELDTRLRPSGSQGMLVTSLDAFARYHRTGPGGSHVVGERAATWQRLALLRARFAAGDSGLGARAIAIARQACYGDRLPAAKMAADVHHLRQRMELELARERPGRYDLKLGRGGLVEIEFAVQLLQLEHGVDPRIDTTDTRTAIEGLAAMGVISSEQTIALADGYQFLRTLEQRLRVLHGRSASLIEVASPGLAPLARRMGIRDLPQASATESLLARYRSVTEAIRHCYEEIVVAKAESVDHRASP